MPGCCENPLATSLALCFSICPFSLSLVLWTHLTPILVLCLGRSTRSHVLFFSMESISWFMDWTQCGSLAASLKDVGWHDINVKILCWSISSNYWWLSLKLWVLWFWNLEDEFMIELELSWGLSGCPCTYNLGMTGWCVCCPEFSVFSGSGSNGFWLSIGRFPDSLQN